VKLSVVSLGRCRDLCIRALEKEYAVRLRRYVSAEIVEVDPGSGDVARAVRKVAGAGGRIVALDERGDIFTSHAFAYYLEKLLASYPRTVFVCGAAGGFPPALRDIFDEKISLSRMTFQHDLARVVFMEQLYRSFTILRGEPYHK